METAGMDFQALVYALFAAAIPVLIAYLERLRRDLQANTEKTDRVNHSLNGDLDKRLDKLAQDIGDRFAESHSELERRISRLEERIFDQQ
jgi:hypothetical protein